MDIRHPVPTNGGDWVKKFGEAWKTQVAQLQEKFKGEVEQVLMPVDYPTDVPILFVKKSSLVEILRFLKETPGCDYNFLADITATDEETAPRFHVVYNLFSIQNKFRIRIKVKVNEGEDIPTSIPVWKGADWAEREVFDMFGIRFQGHPDLRRILMDVRWQGHPLRKDYPLKGYQIFTDPMPVDPSLLD